MINRLHLPALVAVSLVLAGCVVPVPHRRMHSDGFEAKVVDRKSQVPIRGAMVSSVTGEGALAVTDSQGHFGISPQFGWHGAYLIGPISYSMLPHFDITSPRPGFRIDAAGYRPKVVRPFDEIEAEEGTGRTVIHLSPR